MIALLLAAGAGGGAGCGAFATGVSAVPELATSPVVAGAVGSAATGCCAGAVAWGGVEGCTMAEGATVVVCGGSLATGKATGLGRKTFGFGFSTDFVSGTYTAGGVAAWPSP